MNTLPSMNGGYWEFAFNNVNHFIDELNFRILCRVYK